MTGDLAAFTTARGETVAFITARKKSATPGRSRGRWDSRKRENAKRAEAAFRRAMGCMTCWEATRTRSPDRGTLYCDEHRCSGVTEKGTRCMNTATVPETGTCLIHVP